MSIICPFLYKAWLCLYVHINMWDKIIITVEENIIGASKMRNDGTQSKWLQWSLFSIAPH